MLTTASGIIFLIVLLLIGLHLNRAPSATYPMSPSDERDYDLMNPDTSMVFTSRKNSYGKIPQRQVSSHI